jgi:branched-chain amino acid transport system substrate-binding protein
VAATFTMPSGADVEALVQAVETAGSVDPEKVRDALSKVKFVSLYGPIAFNENGQIDLPQTAIQIQGGGLAAIGDPSCEVRRCVFPFMPRIDQHRDDE